MTVGISGPAALGAGTHRSIKDDPEPEALAAPAPKRAPARVAVVLPPPQPHAPRTASPKAVGAATCASGSECMVRLKAMIDDPSRSWIGAPQTAVEYANGTRLFAYRALHGQLNCPQLVTALHEIKTAAKTFRVPVSGVSALQVTRVLALNAEVERELQTERAGRCPG